MTSDPKNEEDAAERAADSILDQFHAIDYPALLRKMADNLQNTPGAGEHLAEEVKHLREVADRVEGRVRK